MKTPIANKPIVNKNIFPSPFSGLAPFLVDRLVSSGPSSDNAGQEGQIPTEFHPKPTAIVGNLKRL
jgi:hypothetical protein